MESKTTLTIREAITQADLALVKELWLEYAHSLGFSLCFQGFDEELATLPGKYAPPAGRLLLAYIDDKVMGAIALRPLEDPTVCEMKRLYVRPESRGAGIGRALVDELIAVARQIGYKQMRLDTVAGKMDAAIKMYRDHGFKEIAPYNFNPQAGVIYMELDLESVAKGKNA
jgi:putative acetyltransferase